jgi:hypothetical protein
MQQFGVDVTQCRPGGFPFDFDAHYIEIIKQVKPFTMTSNERLFSLISAVEYIVKNNIQGDFAECGVYKGGSMMAVALTLLRENCVDRDLYLYDTFTGMTEPTDVDVDLHGKAPNWEVWPLATLDQVKPALFSTNYPAGRIHFVEGRVEDTLPAHMPKRLALLRLDTDWYVSTKHELIHLFPIITSGGVLIIDDYGQYRGSRRAVDEYFFENNVTMLLHRIDFTGRIGVKR